MKTRAVPFIAARAAARYAPVRILHVVDAMDRGGTETWLADLLSRTDPVRFHHDVLTHAAGTAALEDAVRRSGSNLIQVTSARRFWSSAANFRRWNTEHGPYDVIHAHPHQFCGLVLRSAARAGIPVRIAHSHSDTRRIDARANSARKLYLRLAKHWIRRYATLGLAVSRPAAASLFGTAWERDPRISVIYSGVNLEKFTRRSQSWAGIRHGLGFPPEAKVFAHVGRFAEPKNHIFLIEIFSRIAQLEPNAWFALVGDGPLRPTIEACIRRAGIADRTRLLGMRNDVPQILADVVDVLLLPSLWEGLPIVLIESQAAGIPALYSDAITAEAEEVPQLLRRISLQDSAGVWALEAVGMAKAPPAARVCDRLSGGRFDIRSCVARLEEVYSSSLLLEAQ